MSDWRPQPGPQTEFLSRPEDEVLFGGSKGPGKTEALVAEALRQISHPNYRALILRRTYPRLTELIDRSHGIYKNVGGKYLGAEHLWTFPGGARIRFGHCQYERDKENYQGHEYAFIAFDQLEEFTETQYLYISSANRASKPGLRVYIRASANPGGIGHAWVKRRFIDGKESKRRYESEFELPGGIKVKRSSAFVPATVWDNPILLKNNPQYLANLMQLPERTRRGLLFGDWDAFEGQYFAEFDPAIHVVRPFEIPLNWQRFRCLDYGYSAPSACLWCAVDTEGKVYAYRELYQSGLTYSALANAIKSRTKPEERISYTVADPSIWSKSGHTGETGEETLSRNGINVMRGDNDRINGWLRVREYLKSPDGEVRLFIIEDCPNLIRTLPALIHSETRPEDVDSQCEDHATDALRYGMMSRPRTTKAPSEFRVKTYDERVRDFMVQRRRRFARIQSGDWDPVLGKTW